MHWQLCAPPNWDPQHVWEAGCPAIVKPPRAVTYQYAAVQPISTSRRAPCGACELLSILPDSEWAARYKPSVVVASFCGEAAA